MNKRKLASSSLETVVGVLIIVMALFAMSAYVKGGIAGKWKSATEGALGPQYDPAETGFVNEYVKAGSSESVTRMEKRSKIINVTVGDKEYKHKADVWYQVSYQNAGSQGLNDDQGNEVFAEDLDRHSMKEITTKTYNVEIADSLNTNYSSSGSTITNDQIVGDGTAIEDETIDNQTGTGEANEDSDIDNTIVDGTLFCWEDTSPRTYAQVWFTQPAIDCMADYGYTCGAAGVNTTNGSQGVDCTYHGGPVYRQTDCATGVMDLCTEGPSLDTAVIDCPGDAVPSGSYTPNCNNATSGNTGNGTGNGIMGPNSGTSSGTSTELCQTPNGWMPC